MNLQDEQIVYGSLSFYAGLGNHDIGMGVRNGFVLVQHIFAPFSSMRHKGILYIRMHRGIIPVR